mmetsp:Transcript_14476/g.24761  ORF Transcript_14476/g.24761 Transcript_14476/m.24761 type:complete len:298 (-) Transcript_14476:35-928(-)
MSIQEFPPLGFGSWKSEPGKVGDAITIALKAGYRHIDCAALYGNEAEIGKAFADAFKNGIVKREELWVTSKLWNTDWHDVESAVKKTLKDLQLEYLDLYLVHTPASWKPQDDGAMWKMDENGQAIMGTTSVQQMWQQMEKLVDQGLVKRIGVSNFPCILIHDMFCYARIKPFAQQIEVHPYFQQEKNAKYCVSKGLAITAYSPLGNGKGEGPLNDDVVKKIAKEIGASAGQVLIAYSLAKGYTVIPKSTNEKRIKENFESLQFKDKLTADHLKQLDALEKGLRTCDLAEFWKWPLYD